MSQASAPTQLDSRLASYSFLCNESRRILSAGRKRALDFVKEQSVRTCWEVGKLVEAHIKLNGLSEKGRAPYGEKTVKNMARDLAENPLYLYTGWRLAKKHPIFLPAEQLSLSHHKYLLTVDNPKLHGQLIRKAEKENWSKRKLASEIQSLRSRGQVPEPVPIRQSGKRFVPKRGHLYTYELFQEDGKLVVDQGFRKYEDLTPDEARGFKAGDIIEAVPGQKIRKLPDAKPSRLFTYKASLKKIIDADTFWIKIYLTQTGWLNVKLRLRGVDAPEINTEEGRAAKKFVEELFTKGGRLSSLSPLLTIATTKHPDKWDRYLADIFFTKDGTELCLNQLLLETGHARRVETYRDSDWEK